MIYENLRELEVKQYRVRNECTVFQAELLCIYLSVNWFENHAAQFCGKTILLCTDSLSSLLFLQDISTTNKLAVEIQVLVRVLQRKFTFIKFAFVRGHTGVFGNELADQLAKLSTSLSTISHDLCIPKSYWKRQYYEEMIHKWNREYLNSSNAVWTKQFFPSVRL